MCPQKSKKKIVRWTRLLFLSRFCKWYICLVGIDFCRSGERSVAIHSPPIYARCLPRRSLPNDSHFLLYSFFLCFFSFWRQAFTAPFWLLIIETSIFSLAWDRLFLLNVALAELRSRRLTWAIARDWRLRQGWKSLKSGLFPVPTLDEHITKHWQCISSKLKKKTVVQSHTRAGKCLRKVRKAMLLAWSNGRDAPNLVPRP